MADETTPQPQEPTPEQSESPKTKAAKAPKARAEVDGAEGTEAPKAKAKKEALEDKPFPDFIAQDYLPALEKAFAAKNISDLKLSFNNNQVIGEWLKGQRQFTVYFAQPDLNGPRAFSYSTNQAPPSTLEPFLVDERKITLDLLVFGVVQRINAQKWFGGN
jgi:Protein of unknown function (DUF2996)